MYLYIFPIFTYVSQQECVVLSCGYGTGRREGGASLVGFKFGGADGFCVGYLINVWLTSVASWCFHIIWVCSFRGWVTLW